MVRNFANAFILITLYLFDSFLHAADYKVTSFLERDAFVNNSSFPYDKLFSAKDITIQNRYVFLRETDSLAVIWDRVKHVNENNKRNSSEEIDMFSSFVSKTTSGIIENSLSSNKMFFAMQKDGCLKKSEDINSLMLRCGQSKMVYIELIKSLMKNLLLSPVAIVSDDDECTLPLSKTLSSELQKIIQLNNPYYSNSNDNSSNIYNYYVKSSTNVQEIRDVVISIKIRAVSFVILLCHDGLSELMLNLAANFPTLRFKTVWLMVEKRAEIHDSIAPPQLIVVKFDDAPHVKLENSFLAEKRFIEALNLMLVARDAKNRGIISYIDFKSLNTFAEKQLEARNCDKSHSAKTALVSLRKSKFNWRPLYKFTDQSNLILISNDAEFTRVSRSKLRGVTLRIVVAVEQPFIMTLDRLYNKAEESCNNGFRCKEPLADGGWKETCCIGYLMDVLKKLQTDLWFQPDLYIVQDGFYGAYSNGSWNGMVGDLIRNKADVSIAALTNTKGRSEVVDFSEPYLEVSLAVLMLSNHKETLPFINFAFLNQISEELLWALLGVCIVGIILVFLLENLSRNLSRRPTAAKETNAKKGLRHYSLRECFTYFSGLTFQRDLGGRNPKQLATRITAITFAFGMVVVMTTYTAILTASKVTSAESDPFLGFSDHRMTHPTTSFKFGCLANSGTSEYFNTADPTYRSIYLFMKKYNLPSTEEGVKQLKNKQLQAWITEDALANYNAAKQRDCGLKVIKTDKGKSSWAFAFQKGWSWSYLISQKILEYRESGLFTDLNSRWITSSCNIASHGATSHSLHFQHFGGLIFVLVGSFILALLILLLENVCNRYRKRISHPGRDSIMVWRREQRKQGENNIKVLSVRDRNTCDMTMEN
eukprot:gene8227-9107_t